MRTIFDDIDTAYRETVALIKDEGRLVPAVISPTSITTSFGDKPKAFHELTGHTLTVANPRRRLVTNPARAANEQFAIANFLWMLAGRDDHAWIGRFNPKGRRLAEVDGHYPGAHGRRIGMQLQRAVDMLREDPYTRRADILIAREEDMFTHSRDIPCVVALQLLRRPNPGHLVLGRNASSADVLDMVCHMRSQNTIYVFPYDFYAFTMLQEVVAACLGIDVGVYTHQTGSLHVFESDGAVADKISSAPPTMSPEMARMPGIADLSELVQTLVAGERDVQDGVLGKDRNLHPYWLDLLMRLRLGD